ncbi:hypothetical protein GLOIN_2v1762477 [Rhizophagus clarus]|uniref:Uncharacterized protein n=1 Tax=Rhizophagus clarus TaxID=94130 RepID=A0A8H3LXF2_9GLOM|nr:hypothetical protein GLOIN_2v1762477 [Rhizophagus clarus]
MLYQIRRKNIQAELESTQLNNLPIAIKGHHEWNNNTISYRVDESLAIITFIEVEHQKRLSARYFIEKLFRNEVRVETLVIKETDFNAVATSQNLNPEEAEVLKFDQECSIADTMALKYFYMRNLYCKDMTEENLEKSVAEDLRKSYLENYWKVIQELFKILDFTSIDDKRILFDSMSRTKETPDLNSAIKTINAIAGNWYGYTIKSDKKRIGPKEKRIWEQSYQINCQLYKGLSFGDKGAPELPLYRPKTDNDIQELFDSIGQDK